MYGAVHATRCATVRWPEYRIVLGPVTPRGTYESRAANFSSARDVFAMRSRHIAYARSAGYVILLAAGMLLERRPSPATFAILAVVLAAVTTLIVWHRRVRSREDWLRQLAAINQEGLHRLDRDWDALPRHSPMTGLAFHPYAGDIDIFGRASLTQILSVPGSVIGAHTLESWLLAPAPPDTIAARQVAARELASRHELRDALNIRGRRTRRVRQDDVERFLRWAEGGTWLQRRPWLSGLAWLLPLTTWCLIGLQAAGVSNAALVLVPALAVTTTLYITIGGSTRRVLDEAFGRGGMFTHYPELIALVSHAEFASPLLRQAQARLRQNGEPADYQLSRLRQLMYLADLRFASMHFPVFLVSMWDLHILRALERWQTAAGDDVRDWLATVGEFEALASLATLVHDQPGWAFPTVRGGRGQVFRATNLGHPLLHDHVRVCNNVAIGPPGTFLLITGSNMSGKSTLLRSIGLNVVLAQAGAPVCATALSMPPLKLHTCIRVQDSLARGVSYFMAELERLKQLVDAADTVEGDGGEALLFLLDEILHGTNTAERRIAVRRVVRRLVDMSGIGAVTTHDLDLADEPALIPSARLFHFRETLRDQGDGELLTFDFRLREGLATSTNALALMKRIGLPAES